MVALSSHGSVEEKLADLTDVSKYRPELFLLCVQLTGQRWSCATSSGGAAGVAWTMIA